MARTQKPGPPQNALPMCCAEEKTGQEKLLPEAARQTAPNAPLSGMAAPPENTVIIVDVGPTMARPSAVSGFVC